jgi:hypothetical protein
MAAGPNTGPRRSLWSQAAALARRTPESRNRYVDFLRALSIAAVVTGHWLVAAPLFEAGRLTPGHMLAISPWTQWLTWGFQVMPVFFMVGGFSNGISWRAARRSGQDYSSWLASRMSRLVGPVLTLLVAWAALASGALAYGVSITMVKVGSRMALIPVWFLAVYVMVVVLVPVTHAAWERFGMKSFWTLVVAALAVDGAFFTLDLTWLGWSNYMFVWLAVHQLGYAWRDGRLAGTGRTLLWGAAGLLVLIGLVKLGPYPLGMVGVPGEEVSNTRPPKIAMIALGVFQCGLLLSIEGPARRWLARAVPWTATVLVNGMIMTIYLWHLTTMTVIIGLAYALGGLGLTLVPGSAAWWAARPVWMILLAVALVPFVLVFARFERPKERDAASPAAWRLVAGAVAVCLGLALLAMGGVAGEGVLGLRIGALSLPFAGAALMGLGPFGSRAGSAQRHDRELR